MELILASQSPRRRELLALMEIPFRAVSPEVEECPPAGAGPAQTVMALAQQKAEAVLRLYPDACVIGSDTVVDLDGDILGKPHTPERAREYLRRMEGRTHRVYTGVAVLKQNYRDVRHAVTTVTFAHMTEEEIEWYVGTGDPLDKAGAYGVQGKFCPFVEHVEGNYFNIIGMPVPVLYRMLKDADMLRYATDEAGRTLRQTGGAL